MTALERRLPDPDLVEVRAVDVAASPAEAWEAARHVDLAGPAPVRALISLRTLPGRLRGAPAELPLHLDDMVLDARAPPASPCWLTTRPARW